MMQLAIDVKHKMATPIKVLMIRGLDRRARYVWSVFKHTVPCGIIVGQSLASTLVPRKASASIRSRLDGARNVTINDSLHS